MNVAKKRCFRDYIRGFSTRRTGLFLPGNSILCASVEFTDHEDDRINPSMEVSFPSHSCLRFTLAEIFSV